jgi:hypothetical protein
MSLRTSKDNRIPVLELPFQQAGSAQLSGTSRSNDLHNHSRHTARTNTNTSAATMIQINAGSFSYMAAEQYAPIGRCLWKWERPRQEVEPAPGPPLPNLHLGGSRSGAMVKHPLEHSSSSARQSIRVLRGELLVNDRSDEGLKPASQSLTLGLHSLARLRAENISPVFARPGRSSLQRPE